MADAYQIRYIDKSERQNAHERIRFIGGVNAGTRWKLSIQQAIEGMESGKWKFYASVSGSSVWVIIATSQYGYKYLKTENDGEQPNNLLRLPECP